MIISVEIFKIYLNIKEFSLTGVVWGVGGRSNPIPVLGYGDRGPYPAASYPGEAGGKDAQVKEKKAKE